MCITLSCSQGIKYIRSLRKSEASSQGIPSIDQDCQMDMPTLNPCSVPPSSGKEQSRNLARDASLFSIPTQHTSFEDCSLISVSKVE
ncbi:Hypothetical predicted protein [Podarcis lilfordi]|uniref:Uncharacterized protein n=1 Tax=Podarcis lilfordi TaxID=74358 RepID=A0AA35KXJ3_9SAUR|nr:Hypothetical predicted protein [Podarcis lilfordi]